MARKRQTRTRASATSSTLQGVYYLGRVIKLGTLDNEGIINALLNSAQVSANRNEWIIIEGQRLKNRNGRDYVFGKLAKYKPKGKVEVIDPTKHQRVTQDEPNLLIAASPFVYLPEFSGLAHLYVANHIEYSTFAARFADIVVETRGRFFTACTVEAIADLDSFTAKVEKLDSISQISATVQPPNPLFGHLWESLKDFLKKREAASLSLEETAQPDGALKTKLVDHLRSKQASTQLPSETADITDAAVLMAIDGYGEGAVVGKKSKRRVVIKTSETVKHFTFDRDPEAEALHDRAAEVFQAINVDRNLKHE